MKNLFLVLVCLIITAHTAFCQSKINTDDLIGYWEPNKESTQLFFWKDTKGALKMQEISEISGKPLDVISLRVNTDSVFARTIFIPNNWITESTYIFIDKNTLECVVTGDGEDIIVYTKKK
jgi:hypothetical protein